MSFPQDQIREAAADYRQAVFSFMEGAYMTIPGKLNINGIQFDVVEIPGDVPALEPRFCASIQYQNQRITLSQMAPEMQKVSLLHEVIHGMLYALGYDDHDEKLVDGLAHQLFLFIIQNPDMFK